jgi:hypothetical protein
MRVVLPMCPIRNVTYVSGCSKQSGEPDDAIAERAQVRSDNEGSGHHWPIQQLPRIAGTAGVQHAIGDVARIAC